tara:strand:- start:7658 stop:8572 length:915 start_codon:yes stop_codon:yes gene_type:complete
MFINYLVIHHYPCADGELSAAIFKNFNNDKLIEFIPWTHENKDKNMLYIKEQVTKNNSLEIFFLDYCPDFSFICDIFKNVSKIIIIDHHEAACESFKKSLISKSYENLEFIYDNSKSGCQLTWEYFYPNSKYPLSVKHIGNKDIWNWEDNKTEPFTNEYPLYFQLSNNLTPEERLSIYNYILDCDENKFERIVEKGFLNIDKMRNECKSYLPLAEIKFDSDCNDKKLKIINISINKPHLTKYMIEFIQSEFPDADVLRLEKNKDDKIIYSLRSLKSEIRVDLLAQKYGGNGHPLASGYNISLIS